MRISIIAIIVVVIVLQFLHSDARIPEGLSKVKNQTGSHLVSVNGGDAMMLDRMQYGIDTTTIRQQMRRKLKRKNNRRPKRRRKSKRKNNGKCEDKLPKKLTKNKQCKEFKNSCVKLKEKCNAKLGSKIITGSSNLARNCIKTLSSKDRDTQVKWFCEKTCKVCEKKPCVGVCQYYREHVCQLRPGCPNPYE